MMYQEIHTKLGVPFAESALCIILFENATLDHLTMFSLITFVPLFVLLICLVSTKAKEIPASFILIDSNSNNPIGPLPLNLSYVTIRSSTHLFNIEYKPPVNDDVDDINTTSTLNATNITNTTSTTNTTNTTNATSATNATSTTYQSVRFTFDTYNRSYCDTKPPYLLYGYANGTTYGRELFLGERYLTATPYTGLYCRGNAGPTLERRPQIVSGCNVEFVTKRLATRKRIFEIPQGAVLPSHPCNETVQTYKTNFKAKVLCGFPIKSVLIKLYNNTEDGRMVYVHQLTSYSYPHYLFGYRTDYLPGANVRPGNYTIQATINNIPHPAVNFSIVESCFNYTAIHA